MEEILTKFELFEWWHYSVNRSVLEQNFLASSSFLPFYLASFYPRYIVNYGTNTHSGNISVFPANVHNRCFLLDEKGWKRKSKMRLKLHKMQVHHIGDGRRSGDLCAHKITIIGELLFPLEKVFHFNTWVIIFLSSLPRLERRHQNMQHPRHYFSSTKNK